MASSSSSSGGGGGKQLKLNELKRVVNVDTVKKYAAVLEDASNTDSAEIERILDELAKKTPSREILVKTRLGFILKDLSLRKTLPKRVREKAAQLRLKWKEFHKRLLYAEKYDVKCDKPTTEHRERTRQALTNAFKSRSDGDAGAVFDDEQLVAGLEFGLFKYCDCLINAKYFSTTRRLIGAITSVAASATTQAFLRHRIDASEFIASSLVHSEEGDADSNENNSTSSSNQAGSSMPKSLSCMSFSSSSSSSALSNNNQNITTSYKATTTTAKQPTTAAAAAKTVPISAFFKTKSAPSGTSIKSSSSSSSAKTSKYF